MRSQLPAWAELPTLSFDGGETKLFQVGLYTNRDRRVCLSDAKAKLALVDFVNRSGIPLLHKDCTIIDSDDPCVSFTLEPNDTKDLSGKYIYQLTVRDLAGNIEIFRGFLLIRENADRTTIEEFGQK